MPLSDMRLQVIAIKQDLVSLIVFKSLYCLRLSYQVFFEETLEISLLSAFPYLEWTSFL